MSGKSTKKGVMKTWVVALEKYKDAPNPVQKMDQFLKKEFPKRKTNWGKWANLVRQRYNRGALVPGLKPRKAIPRFVSKAA